MFYNFNYSRHNAVGIASHDKLDDPRFEPRWGKKISFFPYSSRANTGAHPVSIINLGSN